MLQRLAISRLLLRCQLSLVQGNKHCRIKPQVVLATVSSKRELLTRTCQNQSLSPWSLSLLRRQFHGPSRTTPNRLYGACPQTAPTLCCASPDATTMLCRDFKAIILPQEKISLLGSTSVRSGIHLGCPTRSKFTLPHGHKPGTLSVSFDFGNGKRNLTIAGFKFPDPEKPAKFYGLCAAVLLGLLVLKALRHEADAEVKEEVAKNLKASKAKTTSLTWGEGEEERKQILGQLQEVSETLPLVATNPVMENGSPKKPQVTNVTNTCIPVDTEVKNLPSSLNTQETNSSDPVVTKAKSPCRSGETKVKNPCSSGDSECPQQVLSYVICPKASSIKAKASPLDAKESAKKGPCEASSQDGEDINCPKLKSAKKDATGPTCQPKDVNTLAYM